MADDQAPRPHGRPAIGARHQIRLSTRDSGLYKMLAGGDLTAGIREGMRLLLEAGLVVDPNAPPAPSAARKRAKRAKSSDPL